MRWAGDEAGRDGGGVQDTVAVHILTGIETGHLHCPDPRAAMIETSWRERLQTLPESAGAPAMSASAVVGVL